MQLVKYRETTIWIKGDFMFITVTGMSANFLQMIRTSQHNQPNAKLFVVAKVGTLFLLFDNIKQDSVI
jgi:hypothetical protein